MAIPERFRIGDIHLERDNATAFAGTDQISAMPVLIYRFGAPLLPAAGSIPNGNLPTLLSSGTDDEGSWLVLGPGGNWRQFADADAPIGARGLLQLVRSLRDGVRAGLVHGDLSPERLILIGNRLSIEGFGVPWRPVAGPFRAPEVETEGSAAGDIWSLAATLAAVGIEVSDETAKSVLEQCRAEDPAERPTAEELCLAFEQLLVGSVARPSRAASQRSSPAPAASVAAAAETTSGEETGEAEGANADKGGAAEDAANRSGSGRGSGSSAIKRESGSSATRRDSGSSATWRASDSPASGRAAGGSPRERQAGSAAADAGERVSRPAGAGTAATGSSGSGAASPAATDRPESRWARRGRRTMLWILSAAILILAVLAIYGPPRFDAPPAARVQAVVYDVEVLVSPADLPPVTIHLVSSPEGSRLENGDVIGTAPRHLALDRPGTWAFRGTVGDRQSPVVEIVVPEERTVTLTLPE